MNAIINESPDKKKQIASSSEHAFLIAVPMSKVNHKTNFEDHIRSQIKKEHFDFVKAIVQTQFSDTKFKSKLTNSDFDPSIFVVAKMATIFQNFVVTCEKNEVSLEGLSCIIGLEPPSIRARICK